MSAVSSLVARSSFQLASSTVGPPGAGNAAASTRRPRLLRSCLGTPSCPAAPSRCAPARICSAVPHSDGDADAGSRPMGPVNARHRGAASGGWVSSATSSARSPRRSDSTATTRPSATGMRPASVSSISRMVSSTRFRAVTWSSSRSRSTALAAYPA